MAGKFSNRPRTHKPPDGQVRQSQMLTTYGPGAMVDLLERAVVVGGLEHWRFPQGPADGHTRMQSLDDPRLRATVQRRLRKLDPELELANEHYFRMAPAGELEEATPKVGVAALEFPRWFVCQGCRRLARYDGFEQKGGGYIHHCESRGRHRAVPVRFVAACMHGHLSDFPWVAYVHDKTDCDRPELYLYEGATGDVSRIVVKCETCNASRSLSGATVLPYGCKGERPWLGGKAMDEGCTERLRMLVRTASNAYFAQVMSALRLPQGAPDPLTQRLTVPDIWADLKHVEDADDLRFCLKKPAVASAIGETPTDRVLAAIEAVRSGQGSTGADKGLRTAEYERLTKAPPERVGQGPPEGAVFAAFEVPKDRAALPEGIARLVVVPVVSEVRVQVAFSRFDSPTANLEGEYEFAGGQVRSAALCVPGGPQKWLPAAEVRGEGIFFELDLAKLAAWEVREAVQERARALLWRQPELLEAAFPAARFFLLHSLSHLLITAISLECGYAASSIRERIYCVGEQAGVLLSTGTLGSEGTLGGLVEEGRRLAHHLRRAWELGRLCSNDPLCAAHDPRSDEDDHDLEGAACHGCLYIAQTSCDRINRRRDRAFVVPTIGNDPKLAYFKERP